MGWRILPLLLLLPACTAWWASAPVDAPLPDDSERLVRRAEAAAQRRDHAEAARLFEEAVRPAHPAYGDRALLGLTRLLVLREYAGRDYDRAAWVAERLVREYPDSPYAAEARAWQDLLAAYLTRSEALAKLERELDANARELDRRGRELTRLQHLDEELERRTQELKVRTQELERQKRLDQELERLAQDLAQELERRTQELQRLKHLDLQLEKQKKKP
jgi:DNA repair exonuclease SbcCD ATPase subunit